MTGNDIERIAYALRTLNYEYGYRIDFSNENIVVVSEYDVTEILKIKNIFCPTMVGITIGMQDVEDYEIPYKAIREFENLVQEEKK